MAWWSQHVYVGQRVDYPFDWSKDEDAEFQMTEEHTVEKVRGMYEANVVRSNEIIAAAPDFETTVQVGDNEYSLRWILVHMIDETVRHAGHMDIIREQLDGATEYLPPDG